MTAGLNRRRLLKAGVAGAIAGVHGLGAAQDKPLVFAINEGATYAISQVPFEQRFREVSEDLAKALHSPVKLVPVPSYPELAAGLAEYRFDLAWVHPAHHAIHAMSVSGYQLVCLTKGYTDYRVSFLVPAGSTARSLQDLRTGKVGAPDQDSITSVIARATLNEALGGQLPPFSYVRYQDAVPFMVEHGMVTAGVSASPSVVKAWQEKGGKVLASSKPVPIKELIASNRITPAQLASARRYFADLDKTDAGKRRLAALGVAGFEEFDQSLLTGIGKWLGA